MFHVCGACRSSVGWSVRSGSPRASRRRVAVVRRQSQPGQRSGQEAEVLLIRDLEALQRRAARVARLRHQISRERSRGRPRLRRDDRIAERLVEVAGLDQPHRRQIPLQQHVEVVGVLRLQVRVADAHGRRVLRVVDDADRPARGPADRDATARGCTTSRTAVLGDVANLNATLGSTST